jgi:polyisoprenoid-binding protein YceI
LRQNTQWLWAAVALCLAPAAFGEQMSVDFDPATTKINWSLVGNVHTSRGTFQLKEGHAKVDSVNGNASGELVVEAETGESGNGARDKRMKKEILETDKYPEIRFKLTKVAGTVSADSASNVRVFGQFSIHGVSHEISIPVTVTLKGADFSGTGKFVVPFVDWGMKDPSNFLFKVDKTVDVELVAAGHVRR